MGWGEGAAGGGGAKAALGVKSAEGKRGGGAALWEPMGPTELPQSPPRCTQDPPRSSRTRSDPSVSPLGPPQVLQDPLRDPNRAPWTPNTPPQRPLRALPLLAFWTPH